MARTGKAWHCAFGAIYGMETGYPTTTPGEWWFPKRKARGRVGIELFTSTSAAVAQAGRNLEQLAAEHGVSPAEMRDRLIAQRDDLRPERRIQVPPLSEFGL